MNKIDKVFQEKKNNILSIYFTAGFPSKDSVVETISALENNGCDMIELGMPFSDPMADGPVIQDCSTKAIKNGMNLPFILSELKRTKEQRNIPVLLMGYLNPVLKYGIDKFIEDASEAGVDGVIIPDFIMQEYLKYEEKFKKHNLHFVFLICPETSSERIREIEKHASGFIYMVSSSSITGKRADATDAQKAYFSRIKDMKLSVPTMIGFGISDNETFNNACQYANGAIIGTAFVKNVNNASSIENDTKAFLKKIKG